MQQSPTFRAHTHAQENLVKEIQWAFNWVYSQAGMVSGNTFDFENVLPGGQETQCCLCYLWRSNVCTIYHSLGTGSSWAHMQDCSKSHVAAGSCSYQIYKLLIFPLSSYFPSCIFMTQLLWLSPIFSTLTHPSWWLSHWISLVYLAKIIYSKGAFLQGCCFAQWFMTETLAWEAQVHTYLLREVRRVTWGSIHLPPYNQVLLPSFLPALCCK